MYNLNIQLPARLAFYVAIRIYSLFVMCPIFLGFVLRPSFFLLLTLTPSYILLLI